MKIVLIGNTPRTRKIRLAWERDSSCVLEWHPHPPAGAAVDPAADLVVCEDTAAPDVRRLINRTLSGPVAQALALLYCSRGGARTPRTAAGLLPFTWTPDGARVLEFHAPLPPRRGLAR